ncbi:hypothetical protein AB0M87_19250 [Streptomyces sp. NPDC051320]
MLDFCGDHGIGTEVEVIPAERINEASSPQRILCHTRGKASPLWLVS